MKKKTSHIFCVKQVILGLSVIALLLTALLPRTASAAGWSGSLNSAITEPAPGHVWYASKGENELPAIPLPGQQKEKRGDADGNGRINYMDALLVLRYSIGLEELSKNAVTRCDVDNKNGLSYMDALMILRYSIGLLNSL